MNDQKQLGNHNDENKEKSVSKDPTIDFDELLLQPYHYLTKIPGKKIRTKLIKSFNYWLNIPIDKLEKIIEIIEMLHNSSLLIDDIQDSSQLRRGIITAHNVYGTPLTINAANYVYFIGLQKALELNNEKIAQIYTEQLLDLHRGQGMEIWFRDNYECPTEVQYCDLVIKKTGGLFKLAIRLMEIYSDEKRDYYPLIDQIGLFFQIRDDFANLTSKEYADSKSFCEDLTEGKFSYPIIHYIKSNQNHQRILDILKLRTNDIELKKEAVNMLEQFGSFKYTLKTLQNLKIKIFEEAKKCGENPYLEKLLAELCKMIDTQQ